MFSKLVGNRAVVSGLRSTNAIRTLPTTASQLTDKRNVSTAQFQTNNPVMDSYQSYFTHNPVEGYIRNSPFDVVTTPNLALDQYVWQNVNKWPNHIATVSLFYDTSSMSRTINNHMDDNVSQVQTFVWRRWAFNSSCCFKFAQSYRVNFVAFYFETNEVKQNERPKVLAKGNKFLLTKALNRMWCWNNFPRMTGWHDIFLSA